MNRADKKACYIGFLAFVIFRYYLIFSRNINGIDLNSERIETEKSRGQKYFCYIFSRISIKLDERVDQRRSCQQKLLEVLNAGRLYTCAYGITESLINYSN